MIIKVAAIQKSSEIGKVKENVAKATALTLSAIQEGANIICMPEMFNTGYFSHTTHAEISYLSLAEPLDGYTIAGTGKKLGQAVSRISKYSVLSTGLCRCDCNGPGHFPGGAARRRALVDNPAALFGVCMK